MPPTAIPTIGPVPSEEEGDFVGSVVAAELMDRMATISCPAFSCHWHWDIEKLERS